MAEEANVQPAFARDGLRRGERSTACPERSEAESNGPNAEPKPKANIERRTPNAERWIRKANVQHSREEEDNAQRSTSNAQRPMSVVSFGVPFRGPDAGEENHDEFFSFVKDGRQL